MMEVVACNQGYWAFVRSLRNNEQTYRQFANPTIIGENEHLAFMAKNESFFRIALLDGVPVGYARVINNDISVCTHPDYYGKGIGKLLINDCMRIWPGAVAKVKTNNIASSKLFLSCEFELISNDTDFLYYKIPGNKPPFMQTAKLYPEEIAQLHQNGYCILKNYVDPDLIESVRKELTEAFSDGKHPHHIVASSSSLHVHNFFLYGKALREILFGKHMQQLHLNFFDRSYSLRNAVGSSIQINTAISDNLHKPIGSDWHRDTPQFADRFGKYHTIGAETTFQIIIAIDRTNETNSTKVLTGSHADPFPGYKLTASELQEMERKYKLENVILNSGDVTIIDDNIFHKAGLATHDSRWLLLCSFTPWFIKPYFDYTQIKMDSQTPYETHCLHQTSISPGYDEQLRNTYQPNNWEE